MILAGIMALVSFLGPEGCAGALAFAAWSALVGELIAACGT